MIEVPASFAAMPRWWSDEAGAAWLRDLPARVGSQCSRWGLQVDGPVMHGSNALIVPVRRSGTALALRMVAPGDDVAGEVHALRVWDGRGVVELVRADAATGAMLLERLDGTRTLETEPIGDAVAVLADLTRVLAVPVPLAVTSTAAIARQERDAFEHRWLRADRPVAEAVLAAVTGSADVLARAEAAATAVDGDLHFGQVLAGRRAPWIVVDPVLLRGDPEYDLGRVLWSRLDEVPRDADVVRLFDSFVERAGVPTDRAARWVAVRAMSYLLWGIEQGLTDDPPRCRRLLAIFA